jgi:hypothetical protein
MSNKFFRIDIMGKESKAPNPFFPMPATRECGVLVIGSVDRDFAAALAAACLANTKWSVLISA